MIIEAMLICTVFTPRECAKAVDVRLVGKDGVEVVCRTDSGDLKLYRGYLPEGSRPEKVDTTPNPSKWQIDRIQVECIKEGW